MKSSYNPRKCTKELNVVNAFSLAGFDMFFGTVNACALILFTGWMIFKKAGKPGWAVFVPIYNFYLLSDFVFGNLNYFIVTLVVMAVSFFGWLLNITFLSVLATLASIALSIIYCIKLSRVFGKSDAFAAGLIFLPMVFFPMLGFGNAKYTRPPIR